MLPGLCLIALWAAHVHGSELNTSWPRKVQKKSTGNPIVPIAFEACLHLLEGESCSSFQSEYDNALAIHEKLKRGVHARGISVEKLVIMV